MKRNNNPGETMTTKTYGTIESELARIDYVSEGVLCLHPATTCRSSERRMSAHNARRPHCRYEVVAVDHSDRHALVTVVAI